MSPERRLAGRASIIPVFWGLRVAQDTGHPVPMLAKSLADQDRVAILLPGPMCSMYKQPSEMSPNMSQ